MTVTNSGPAPLTITSLSVVGANPSDFSTVSDACTGASLAPLASCTVGVTFSPQAGGARTATLSIVDNAPGSPQTVRLSGTGVAVPPPGCTIVWTGSAGDGQWTTAASWSPVRVPEATDFACIPSSVTGQVTLASGTSVRGVRSEGAGGLLIGGGTLQLTDPGAPSTILDLTLAGGVSLDAGVDLLLAGTAEWQSGEFFGPGTTTIALGATLNIPENGGGNRFVVDGHVLSNEGTVNRSGGSWVVSNAVFANAGLLRVAGSDGFAASQFGGRIDNLATGVVERDGTGVVSIDGEFNNDGTVRLVSGVLQVQGDYANPSGSTLEFVVAGPNPGTDFGQFVVTGTCSLGETLSATSAAGFTPTPGQPFTIVTCGTRTAPSPARAPPTRFSTTPPTSRSTRPVPPFR